VSPLRVKEGMNMFPHGDKFTPRVKLQPYIGVSLMSKTSIGCTMGKDRKRRRNCSIVGERQHMSAVSEKPGDSIASEPNIILYLVALLLPM
jgi:hypothetical protein